MASIPSFQPIQQEEHQTFPESRPTRQERLTTCLPAGMAYRYVSRLTPERVKTLTPEQKEQALLEFLTLFNLILSVIYNPVAKEATRLLALDVIVTQIQRTARKIIGSITDKSPTHLDTVGERLGLHKNTVSSGYAALEKAGCLERTYRDGEKHPNQHLDIQPTPLLFTEPSMIRDKKKRAAPKPPLAKPLDISKACIECGSHNLRVTCRDCGSFIDLGEGVPRIVDADVSADRQTERQTDETHHKICDDIQNPISVTNFVTALESVAKESPITPPLNAEEILTTWLAKRIGEGQLIYATGQTEQKAKYITLPVGTMPNIKAYLKGDPRHIYGSRLATHNTTSVLCFDLDDPQQDAQIETYLSTLTQAGAKPLYWHRQNKRGHLELYFSQPVNTEAAYQWCVSVCPLLAEIPECYPVKDKKSNGFSWPLYQRVGNIVYECPVSYWALRGLETIGGMISDPYAVEELIEKAVTPSKLIPLIPETQPAELRDGGVLLEKNQEVTQANKRGNYAQEADLAKEVIALFNNAYTWEEVTSLCGGLVNNRFRAVWRGEDKPSVVIDPNGLYACDYGRIGDCYPKKLDKYEVWCLAQGINKKADFQERKRVYLASLSCSVQTLSVQETSLSTTAQPKLSGHACRQAGYTRLINPKDERGIPLYCSKCSEKTARIGAGCTTYCVTHWLEYKRSVV